MIRSTEAQIDVPNCPTCATSMRLLRVIPSITEDLENQVFACKECGTEITRIVRLGK
jgi:transposase-like protein